MESIRAYPYLVSSLSATWTFQLPIAAINYRSDLSDNW